MLASIVLSFLLLTSLPVQESYVQSPQIHQCAATTKKGTRCKNNALKGSKYCQVHQAKDPKVQQCKAITQKGERCSRAATNAGYCKQHYEMHKAGKI